MSHTWNRKNHEVPWHKFYHSWPAWWDTLYHRRPQRRRERALCRAVLIGRRDPDEISWPSGRKPHVYYW